MLSIKFIIIVNISGKIIISVLEPISTKDVAISDTDILTEKVKKLMTDEFEKLQKETSYN